MNRFSRVGLGLVSLLMASTFLTGVARADGLPPPPEHSSVDQNGVDLTSGAFLMRSPGLSVGDPSNGGLTYSREYQNGWRDTTVGYITATPGGLAVTVGGTAQFFAFGTVNSFYPVDGSSATLTSDASGAYTYTSTTGAVYVFQVSGQDALLSSVYAKLTTATNPDGRMTTFDYQTSTGSLTAKRVTTITNSSGYQLVFTYASNVNPTDTASLKTWQTVVGVQGVNLAVSTTPQVAMSIARAADGSYEDVTDADGNVTHFTYTAEKITGIRRPGRTANDVNVTYDTSGRVQTYNDVGGTWTYSYTDVGDGRTTLVVDPVAQSRLATDPTAHYRVVTGSISRSYITSDKDALDHIITYDHDPTYGWLTQVTSPEGNYVTYAHDARGNVTTVTRVAKPGSGLANIVTTTGYPADCTNHVTCNLPTSVVDERGKETDYSYNQTTGQLTSVLRPPPHSGQIAPKTNYSYSQVKAVYTVNGSQVDGSPISMLSKISECLTSSAGTCAGTQDESQITYNYGVAGFPKNLLVLSSTIGSGNSTGLGAMRLTTTYTYNGNGDVASIDGPLSGPNDTNFFRYDLSHRKVGQIGPDPDLAGPLKRRAIRTAYMPDGQIDTLEQGTVDGITDADWTGFTSLILQNYTYDARGRQIRLSGNGLTTEYSFDPFGRPDCTAVRISGTSGTAACTVNTGTSGPDRVTKFSYDAMNRIISRTSAYGVSGVATVETTSYTGNGLPATIQDGEGHLTTYVYDGFDRLWKRQYPNLTGGGSSTADPDVYTLDAASNITRLTRHNSSVVSYTYDDLNRVETQGIGGTSDDVVYTYNNSDWLMSATSAREALAYTYNAIGWVKSEAGAMGSVAYVYDQGGRRTRMTWPDGYFVTYDFDNTDAMTAIHENGDTTPTGLLASFSYNDMGRRSTMGQGNGGLVTYGYNPKGLLTTQNLDLPGTGSDVLITLNTRNTAGQVTKRTIGNPAYEYSALGNSNTNYTIDGRNRYNTVNSTTFVYNVQGDLNSDGVGAYNYNFLGQLTAVNGADLQLVYDPIGRMFSKTSPVDVTKFVYDGSNLIAEYNSSGTLLRRYVHGPAADEPLVWYEGSGTTDRRWLTADDRGSIVATTTAAGATTINSYDEYGIPAPSNSGRFGYTGQQWLAEAGLYYYKARTYAPKLGRFLQPDPNDFGDGLNLYAYVAGDPINFSDPTGLVSCGQLSVHRDVYASFGGVVQQTPYASYDFALNLDCGPSDGRGGGNPMGPLGQYDPHNGYLQLASIPKPLVDTYFLFRQKQKKNVYTTLRKLLGSHFNDQQIVSIVNDILKEKRTDVGDIAIFDGVRPNDNGTVNLTAGQAAMVNRLLHDLPRTSLNIDAINYYNASVAAKRVIIGH